MDSTTFADLLAAATTFFGIIILVFGLVKLSYVPLALVFEATARRRRKKHRWSLADEHPLVSVVVPGFNEEAVIDNCVESILASDYGNFEIILVDDGSSDATPEHMSRLATEHPTVTFIRQPNQGKGAALNTGARATAGDVLMFVDADGIFSADTVDRMLEGFTDDSVGAVCGDDRPVNLNRIQTRLLTVISHVGTGLVRRALTVLRCLPIVSGNSGAFRRDVIAVTGPFETATVGEDLEMTWRIHKAGYRVNFAPRALVYAESPSTIGGLWKQRVRWARGLLQTMGIQAKMIGNPRYRAFGAYLVFNTITMVIIPVLQLLVLALIPVLLLTGSSPLPEGWIAVLAWLGLIVVIVLAVFSMALNNALKDIRHLWTVPLWPIYSVFVGLTMVWGIWLQLARRPSSWNKLHRTGIISITGSRPGAGTHAK